MKDWRDDKAEIDAAMAVEEDQMIIAAKARQAEREDRADIRCVAEMAARLWLDDVSRTVDKPVEEALSIFRAAQAAMQKGRGEP
jgi:hypothetical protein